MCTVQNLLSNLIILSYQIAKRSMNVTEIALLRLSMQRLKVNDQGESVSMLVRQYVNCINNNESDVMVPKCLSLF